MVTLTIRHHEGQSLKDCWDAVANGWNAVTSGKQWVTDSARYGLVGWVKVVEVTKGASGWHVHVHALLVWDNKVKRSSMRWVANRMHRRWTRRVQKRGFDSWREKGGLNVRLATLKPGKGSGLHEYFVKLAHEITGGQAKLAKGAGRTPFQLLTDALASGEVTDARAWQEWERGSLGRRQIAWSKGLRDWANLGQEQTDEEIAAEELQGEPAVALMPEGWHWLRDRPLAVCELHEYSERGGFPAAMRLLDSWGVAYMEMTLTPKPPPVAQDHEHWQLRRDRAQEAHRLVGSMARELAEEQEWNVRLRALGIR